MINSGVPKSRCHSIRTPSCWDHHSQICACLSFRPSRIPKYESPMHHEFPGLVRVIPKKRSKSVSGMVLRWYLHLFTSDIQVSKFSIYFEVAIYSIEWEPIAHNLRSRYSGPLSTPFFHHPRVHCKNYLDPVYRLLKIMNTNKLHHMYIIHK